MKSRDLKSSEFNEYYSIYINKLNQETDLVHCYTKGRDHVVEFFNNIPPEKHLYRYQPNKWTIKELLQHLIDTERIFMYRCLRIARNDASPLTGFDQNIYIAPSQANEKKMEDLIHEFKINRENSIVLLKSLSDENLCYIGNAGGSDLSARAAAFIIPGHDIWHMEIIKERYL